jgi:hypothetical protein
MHRPAFRLVALTLLALLSLVRPAPAQGRLAFGIAAGPSPYDARLSPRLHRAPREERCSWMLTHKADHTSSELP